MHGAVRHVQCMHAPTALCTHPHRPPTHAPAHMYPSHTGQPPPHTLAGGARLVPGRPPHLPPAGGRNGQLRCPGLGRGHRPAHAQQGSVCVCRLVMACDSRALTMLHISMEMDAWHRMLRQLQVFHELPSQFTVLSMSRPSRLLLRRAGPSPACVFCSVRSSPSAPFHSR